MEDSKFCSILNLVRLALRIVGCDIFEENWRPSALTFISIFIVALYPFIAVVFLVKNSDHMSTEHIADSVACLLACLDSILAILEYVINRDDWKFVMQEIHNRRFLYKSERISQLFDSYYERNYQFCKALFGFYTFAAMSRLFAPFLPNPDQYNLPLASLLPFIDPSEPYFYSANYLYQVTMCFTTAFCLISQCMSLVTGIMSACCQIRALKIKLEELNEKLGDPTVNSRTVHETLGEAIYLHTRTKEFIELIQNKFGLLYLSMFMTCNGVICMCINVIVDNIFTSTTLLCLAGFMGILVNCFFGNLLLVENDTLPDKIYDIDWYKLDSSGQKSLKMMLRNAQTDALLHAFFMPLNMGTFIAVMKASFSYYSILNTT